MSSRIWRTLSIGALCGASGLFALGLRGDEPQASDAQPAKPSVSVDPSQLPKQATDEKDKNIVYLSEGRDLWIDKKNKQVVMKGKIAVREGNLEMFACPQQSKEYESIIAVTPRKMESVHAGLLAVGAKPGHPAKFDTKFTPATGSRVDVAVRWTDNEGKQREARGQDWVRNIKTGKPLEFGWVFGGSGFWTDPDSGEKRYQANDGDFICVVNFPDSMLDLSMESPKDWSEHFYEPFTDRIP
ncbi:MAG TPA: YdjY domain-containing protein, partial [Pirellulales bacterium]|nr:YdjY domain-containing protein [Pirellulales bacterium]